MSRGVIGLRLAFGMVPRIVVFEHGGQWNGRETGGRGDRAFRNRIKGRLVSLSVKCNGPQYSYGISFDRS